MDSPINLKLAQRRREEAAGLAEPSSAPASSPAAPASGIKFFKGAPITEAEKADRAKRLADKLRARGG